MEKLIGCCFWVLSFSVLANNVIDLYGMESDKSLMIIKKYSKDISTIANSMNRLMEDNQSFNEDEAYKNKIKTYQLSEKIKKEFGLLYVDFDTVFYPKNKTVYTTIEVIESSNPERMLYVHNEVVKKHTGNKNDVISSMIEYEKIGMQLAMKNQINFKNNPCPVYHCLSGFNHPKLKPYLQLFNLGVKKDKEFILDTLQYDSDAERRGAAAFLVGHFSNPKEIISVLSSAINDKDGLVRNNAIRVIGETMQRANIVEIDVYPFLNLLSSPYDTDRNKSLYVLLQAAKIDSNKSIIIQKGAHNLLAMLMLKQPNNHDLSYKLLKLISGKDFGDKSLIAWKKWFVEEQHVSA